MYITTVKLLGISTQDRAGPGKRSHRVCHIQTCFSRICEQVHHGCGMLNRNSIYQSMTWATNIPPNSVLRQTKFRVPKLRQWKPCRRGPSFYFIFCPCPSLVFQLTVHCRSIRLLYLRVGVTLSQRVYRGHFRKAFLCGSCVRPRRGDLFVHHARTAGSVEDIYMSVLAKYIYSTFLTLLYGQKMLVNINVCSMVSETTHP